MTAGTHGFDPVRLEPFSTGLRRHRGGLLRDVGGRGGNVLAEKLSQNPLSTQYRGRFVGVGKDGEQAGVGQQTTALPGDGRPNGGLRTDRRKTIVSCQSIVHEAEVGGEELPRRDGPRGNFAKQEKGLLAHGTAQVFVERLEDRGIGRDVVEVALIEPLGSEVLDERCGLWIGHEATYLSANVVFIRELVGSGCAKELFVGHRAPHEVRQARSELVTIERARSGRHWIAIVLDAKEKPRRKKHDLKNAPERLIAAVA